MKRIVEKPFIFFWALIPLVIIIGRFLHDTTFDINVHDTYYIITYGGLTNLVSILLGLIGLGYWIFYYLKRKLSYRLNAIHILITALGPIGIWIVSNFHREIIPGSDFQSIMKDSEFNDNLLLLTFIILLLTILGQVIYLINLVTAFLKSIKTKS
ncbi:hypothetical protein [Maribacter polysiphoniae]|jgi:heme/copper-type cytochrome/quinol oxidase subunit 1|uniref:hypothetical protein n=1 Tax=Maribacter polysiphoniae TaxID=429344 RepID=UPI0023566F61|nr:hypothetical protein [Maribacter polysiphoniae]